MTSTEQSSTNVKPALYLGAFLISLVGGILFFTSEFGWWQTTYSWGYDFATYGEFVPWYGVLFLIILGLAYLFVAFVSLYKLYPFFKLNDDTVDTLERIAFFTAIGVVALTIIIAIAFAIMVSDATDWDFGTTFYTGLIGGLVTTLLLWFANKNETKK